MFLIYVILNIFILKLTELADRTYKKYIFKKMQRTKKIIVLERRPSKYSEYFKIVNIKSKS